MKQKYEILKVRVCILVVVIWNTNLIFSAVSYVYCHLHPVWFNNIIPHYLINGTMGELLSMNYLFLLILVY